jgi:hypothetical protein
LNVLSHDELAVSSKSFEEINASIFILKPEVVGILFLAVADADESLSIGKDWRRLFLARAFVEANFSNHKSG